jgi:uncharacterized protein DUF4164
MKPAANGLSNSAPSMGKSGGGNMGAVRRAGRGRSGKDKEAEGNAEIEDGAGAASASEAARLRAELDSERERTQKLQAANLQVTERLNEAIASIRKLLERQG